MYISSQSWASLVVVNQVQLNDLIDARLILADSGKDRVTLFCEKTIATGETR